MYFSEREAERRFAGLRRRMRDERLDAVMVFNGGEFHFAQDEFYLLQNDFIPAGTSFTVFVRDEPPVVVCQSLQAVSHRLRSTSDDVRVVPEGADEGEYLADLLAEKGVTTGRIGWRSALVRASWQQAVARRMPALEAVDIADLMTDLLYERSAEEAEASIASAKLADGGYHRIVQLIRPGVTEREIVAEFEQHCVAGGANRNFTIVSSGAPGTRDEFPDLAWPTDRALESGDQVVLEMTPAVAGYYTQLVRTICVDAFDAELDALRAVAVQVIATAAQSLAPGTTVGALARTVLDAVAELGYETEYPLGHVVGVNLIYHRLLPDVTRELHEHDTVIIHPRITDPRTKRSIFWGETYLVTGDGCRPLHAASSELRVAALERE